jgi:GH15 family glucan-1,4-alpha-glucosidase
MRPLIFGNGSLLVCVDDRGVVRDFYYPYAGMENHGGFMRLGLFDLSRKRFAWLEDWEKRQSYVREPADVREPAASKESAANASMVGETNFSRPDFGAEHNRVLAIHSRLRFTSLELRGQHSPFTVVTAEIEHHTDVWPHIQLHAGVPPA